MARPHYGEGWCRGQWRLGRARGRGLDPRGVGHIGRGWSRDMPVGGLAGGLIDQGLATLIAAPLQFRPGGSEQPFRGRLVTAQPRPFGPQVELQSLVPVTPKRRDVDMIIDRLRSGD
jgi:hypothetical protein